VEELKEESARIIRGVVDRLYHLVPGKIAVEDPPRPGMGDLASPVAFELARALKRPPRVIAQEIAAEFPRPAWLARVEAGGAGYLNLFFDRAESQYVLQNIPPMFVTVFHKVTRRNGHHRPLRPAAVLSTTNHHSA